MATPQYNRIIRKLVVGFGNLFNEITLVRYNPDMSEAERFLVPIAYAAKEDYVMRLQEDPDLNKKIQVALPRMSFQMTGMHYDASRKLNTNTKSFAQTASGVVSQYNPVPYNFDFELYLYVRNIEDGNQIIEYILPYFTPDYTVKLNLVPEMGIIKEVPIILNDVDMPVDFEGDRTRESRIIIWTLSFTVKGFLYGGVSDTGLITHSITSIYQKISPQDTIEFMMNATTGEPGMGTYQIGEIVYQGYSHSTAVATGKVVLFDNNKLTLTNINGNFVSTLPIRSSRNPNTSYSFTSYSPVPQQLVQIDVVPEPPTANASDAWTANTTIREWPYIE